LNHAPQYYNIVAQTLNYSVNVNCRDGSDGKCTNKDTNDGDKEFFSSNLSLIQHTLVVSCKRGDDISLTKINLPTFKWGILCWRSVTSFPHVMTKKRIRVRFMFHPGDGSCTRVTGYHHLVLAGKQPLFLEILQGSSPSYFGG
jgi:hypothetical protein